MCSVIVPIHEAISQYGGLMLGLVASDMVLEVEDSFTNVFKLSSLSR